MQNLQRGPVDPDPANNMADVTVIHVVDSDHGPVTEYGTIEDVIAMAVIESAAHVRNAGAKRCGGR
ncbi:hypothetical protein MRBLMR1_004850 [Neorhizobium sp. LMR1-1-1.1]